MHGHPGFDMMPPPEMYDYPFEEEYGHPECEMGPPMMDHHGGHHRRGGFLEMPGMEHGREERPRQHRGGRRGGRRPGGRMGPGGGLHGHPEEDLAAGMAGMGFEDHPGRSQMSGPERLMDRLRTPRRRNGELMDHEEGPHGGGGRRSGGRHHELEMMGHGGEGRRGRGGRGHGGMMGPRGGPRMPPPGMGYSDEGGEGPGYSSEDEGLVMDHMLGRRGHPGPRGGMRHHGGQ
ncbi:MAG: hypothetical protein Q9167_006175 [Letrouitia subvulpina]